VQVSFRSSPSFLRKQQRYYAIMAKLKTIYLRWNFDDVFIPCETRLLLEMYF